MPNVQQLTVTYDNKSQLTLELQNPQYTGFKQAPLFVLYYAEHQEGNYGDDEPEEGKCHYMVSGTEYFPANKYDEAFEEFCKRIKHPEPWKAGIHSYSLQQCLETKARGQTSCFYHVDDAPFVGRGDLRPTTVTLVK